MGQRVVHDRIQLLRVFFAVFADLPYVLELAAVVVSRLGASEVGVEARVFEDFVATSKRLFDDATVATLCGWADSAADEDVFLRGRQARVNV